jgi:tight adherence protein C
MLPKFQVDSLTLATLAAVGFLALLAAWMVLKLRQPGLRRVREVASRQAFERVSRVRRSSMRLSSRSLMHRVVTRLNLVRRVQAQALMQRLASAGWRSGDALTMYLFCKLVLPLLLPVAVAALLLSTSALGIFPVWSRLPGLAAVAVLGFFLPDIWVKNAAQKRQGKIQLALPDALDLMVTCSEAGLSLEALLKRVGTEMVKSGPELADEFGLTCIEMEFLPDRRQALVNLAERTNLPGIRALVNSLQQSTKFGTPLSQAMRVLASEFRDERILRAEEKAARLPVLLTIPMVIFILPPVIMVIVGPAILRVADNFTGRF